MPLSARFMEFRRSRTQDARGDDRHMPDQVMSRLGDHSLDRAAERVLAATPATTPDHHPRIPVVARVVWARAGEETIDR
jgi:hypothetical protein